MLKITHLKDCLSGMILLSLQDFKDVHDGIIYALNSPLNDLHRNESDYFCNSSHIFEHVILYSFHAVLHKNELNYGNIKNVIESY